MEKRVLLAAVLSGVVIVLWFTLVAPPAKNPPRPEPGAVTQGTPAQAAAVPAQSTPGTRPTESTANAELAKAAPPAIQGEDPSDIILAGGGIRVVVSPRGAVIRSVVVGDYKTSAGKPLELVRSDGPGSLSMASKGSWNEELYRVDKRPDGVVLSWSDGAGNWIEKRMAVGSGKFSLAVSVKCGGSGCGGMVVGSGIAPEAASDQSPTRFAVNAAVVHLDGKVDQINVAKLDTPRNLQGKVEFAGVENQYFLLAWLPDERQQEVRVRRDDHGAPEVVVAPVAGLFSGVLFAGPKDHAVLMGYGRGLVDTMSFGIFGFLSVGFLAALKWIHSSTGNWGIAIILLTAAIRVLLFPLNHKSAVSMKKMQAVQPKMKAIQERYQDRAKKDPQVRNRMNQEIMQLYKTEGVNPMGGCLPLVVQMPILFAMYTLFANAIELRHAPFLLWITDLSQPDTLFSIPLFGWTLPIRPLALLMGGTMFWQQRLTPQVGDPSQRQIFMLMPVIFTMMFYSFPAGPVLYWLVNNLFTIAQQVVTNRMMEKSAAQVTVG